MMSANPFSLEGKTILVTGASSGIGRGIAIECSKMGAKLVINGRNEARLNETLSNLEGNGHIAIISDLTNQEGFDKLVADCPEINGFVPCAGIPKISNVKHISRRDLSEIVEINQNVPILLTSALLKKKKLQKKSSIVFIASLSGIYVANPGDSLYSATKGAINGFAKGAALELAPQGTRVNTLCPGFTPTSILESSKEMFSEEEVMASTNGKFPLNRLGKPEDIAYAAIYLLSDASSWVTGAELKIDGGYSLI